MSFTQNYLQAQMKRRRRETKLLPASVFSFCVISLTEYISHLVYKRLVLKIAVFNFGELFEQFALFLCQSFWRYERRGDKQIAFPATAESGHSFRFYAKNSSRLRSRRNFQIFLALERFNFNFCAERG